MPVDDVKATRAFLAAIDEYTRGMGSPAPVLNAWAALPAALQQEATALAKADGIETSFMNLVAPVSELDCAIGAS